MQKTLRHLITVGLAVALAVPGTLAGSLVAEAPARAFADEVEEAQQAVDDAQATADNAEANVDALAAEYDALAAEVAAMQAQIDEAAARALEAQKGVIEGRNALGKVAAYQYRGGGSAQSLFALLMDSQNFTDLLRNLGYLDAVVQYQSDEIAAQRERTERFDAIVADLNAQKDAQEKKLAELEAKRAEAQVAAEAANSALASAQTEAAARIEELKRKAEEQAAQGSSAPAAVDEANTIDRPDAQGPVQPNPDPDPPSPEVSPDPGIGWSSGIASAYGGSTDPYTPNPGITATGDVCDDWSMGVAVPMAWSGYWRYYGRTVEISYGGTTVFAVVNDCGYMGGGSRVLDLQPGVWKAFGYSSCNDWGLRTVNYRFL